MGRISGILFDKDGTLLDYHRSWMPANRAAALLAARGDVGLSEQLLSLGGYDLEQERVRSGSVMAAGTAVELASIWAEVAPGWEAGDLTEEINRIFLEACSADAVPVGNLAAFFDRLKGLGMTLGVATSDSYGGALASLEPFDVLDRLDFLTGYDSGHGIKPGPGMVEAFCRATDLGVGAVAVVGDNRHDLEMGRNAGAGLVVGVLTGTGEREELTALADQVLDDVFGLEALLQAS